MLVTGIKGRQETVVNNANTAKVLGSVDRRRLIFLASVYDENGKIGDATHERFIINNEKFMDKAINKFH